MTKIAVLGEKKMVLAFRSLGLDVFGIESDSEFEEAFQKVKDYNILFITDSMAKKHESRIAPLYSQPLPAILIIPGHKDDRDYGTASLNKTIERALGSSDMAGSQD